MKKMNHNLMRNFIKYFFLLAVFIVVSCSEENIYDEKDIAFESLISTKNGILVFDTQERFNETLNSLRNNSNLMETWKVEHPNYNNMLDATERAFDDINNENKFKSVQDVINKYGTLIHHEIDSKGEVSLLRNHADDALALLLNEEGMIQIGENFFKVGQNNIYQVNSKNSEILLTNKLSDPLVTSYTIDRFTIDEKLSNLNAKIPLGVLGKNTYTYSSGDKRLNGKITAGLYAPIAYDYILVFETLHQKKNIFGAWAERKTKKLRLYASVLNHSADTGYKKKKKRLSYSISVCTGASIDILNNECYYQATSKNYCKCDNGVYTDVSVSVSK